MTGFGYSGSIEDMGYSGSIEEILLCGSGLV